MKRNHLFKIGTRVCHIDPSLEEHLAFGTVIGECVGDNFRQVLFDGHQTAGMGIYIHTLIICCNDQA